MHLALLSHALQDEEFCIRALSGVLILAGDINGEQAMNKAQGRILELVNLRVMRGLSSCAELLVS